MSNKIPLISIVMLNYNGLNYLRRTIPPILNLNYPNYEFIIVDNGSTDGSIDFINSFRRIKLIQSPRPREKNFACNYAIKKSRGRYILLLDNDALIVNKDILVELISRYNSNPLTGVIGLSFIDDMNTKSKSYGEYFSYYFIKEKIGKLKDDLVKYDNSLTGYPEGKGLFIKKTIWQEVDGYDDHLKFGGDDNDLGIKLWLRGYRNYLYSKTIQIHLGLPEQQDNKKFTLKWKEMTHAHLYTIVKNYSILNMWITLIGFSFFTFIRSIKQSVFRCNLGPFVSFFQGYCSFLKDISYNLKKRKEIQSMRKIKEDLFLNIKPPKNENA